MEFQRSATSPKMILRVTDVLRRTGFCRSALYNRIAKGEFPHQVSLGGPLSERIDPRARVSVAPIRTDPFRRGTVLICAKLSFVRYVVLRALDRVVSN